MPDPTFKIDSTTVLSKSGTTVSVDSGGTVPASIGASLVYLESTSGTAVSELKFENNCLKGIFIEFLQIGYASDNFIYA